MTYFSKYACSKVSLMALFLLIVQFSSAQFDFTGVDSKVTQYQKQLGGNVVVLVSKDDKIIYQKAIGKEVTVTTQAPLYASSQWLTAALVMTFVQEGKLSLDDPVSKYLPIFATYMKSYITVRQCLNHTTGVAGEKGLVRRLKGYASLEEEVNEIASKKEIEARPGAEFIYNNQGLNIAGRILEVISKKPFDRLMTDRILRPLGMKNTAFNNDKAINPSLGAVSSAMDFIHFQQMLVNKGVYNNKRVLSEASVLEMEAATTTPAIIKYSPASTQGYTYCSGAWMQSTEEQEKATVFCSPSFNGTWPAIDTKNKYAFIVFTTSAQGEVKREVYLEIKTAIDNAIAAQ